MRTSARVTAVVLLVVVLGLFCHALPQDTYTSRFDHIDVDSFLRNERALNSIIKCILDQGRCTAEGKELKANLPDALQTNCTKCTDAQKRIMRKASKFLQEHRTDDWQKIVDKYDPERQYQEEFRKFLAGE